MGTDGASTRKASPAWFRTVLLLTLLGVTAWAVVPGRAQNTEAPEIVTDVIPFGNRTVPSDKVLRYVRTRPGSVFSYATLQEDVARLAESGLFKNPSADKKVVYDERTKETRIVVYIHVPEFPNVVQEVVYRNAHHISKKDLDDMTRIRKGMPLDPSLNKKACYEIQDYLKKKGRYFANVTLEEGWDPSHTRVVFNITEGPVVRVRSINFTGQEKLATSGRLRTQVDSSRPFLYLIKGEYNPLMVESDVLKLEDYYRYNGYLGVHVTREMKFSDDFQWVDLTFHIREGQQYRISNIGVEGPKQLDRQQVESILQAQAGKTYNEGIINADVRNISDLYGWRGYPVQVQKDLYETEPGVVRVQYTVQESKPFKVGQVIIVGNDVTQDHVIRRVIDIYPGQVIPLPEVRRAEANLARLGLFEINPELGIRPTVTVLDGPPGSDHKDILVQVKEAKTGSLLLGGGLNSDNGVFGSIVLNEKNFNIFRLPRSWDDIVEGKAFRGGGQEFRIEAVPGNELQRYSISFREPFLFDRPYSLTVGGFYWDRSFNEYVEGRAGGRMSVGHSFTPAFGGSVGFRLENIQVSNVADWAPEDYKMVRGGNFQVVPRIGVTWDTRDSALKPTEGGVMEASVEYGLGDFNFPILNLEASRYFTLGKPGSFFQRADQSGKHVMAVRSSVSWAGDDTPVYERFFAGGYRSLRGFAFRGVGPRQDGFNLGGDFMFLNSIEYQMPVVASDQLYFVAFIDSGTVERRFEIKDYRVSAGVGARIMIPALGPVPIALDFGFPIVRGPGDEEQMFSFWIGLFR